CDRETGVPRHEARELSKFASYLEQATLLCVGIPVLKGFDHGVELPEHRLAVQAALARLIPPPKQLYRAFKAVNFVPTYLPGIDRSDGGAGGPLRDWNDQSCTCQQRQLQEFSTRCHVAPDEFNDVADSGQLWAHRLNSGD